MKTELIASWKLVNTKNGEMYIVTTDKGNTIWCTKSQFDSNCDTITFRELKAGSTYKKTDGTEGTLSADRNELLGCGKQVIKKFNTLEIMDHLTSKGITPTFALS